MSATEDTTTKQRRTPGPVSLRGRYLLMLLGTSLILLGIAYASWRYVDDISRNQLWQIQYRSEASDAQDDVTLQIHRVETSLQRFVTRPDEDNRRAIERAFNLLDSSLIILRNNPWIVADPALTDLVLALEKDRKQLLKAVERLIDVRLDETEWFPAMAIMQDRMLQHNMEFTSSLDLVEHDISDELENPNAQALHDLLSDIRYTWSQMISEFRLFVSNSFGVFSTVPERGTQARQNNIKLYENRLKHLVKKVRQQGADNPYVSTNRELFDSMERAARQWQAAYEDVLSSFDVDLWRYDLVLLRDQIQPLFRRMGQRSSALSLELGVASAKDITQLTDVARQFSNFIVYLAIFVVLGGLLGFVFFNRSVLRPLSTIADALYAEANEQRAPPISSNSALEVRQLTDAFNHMREQIRSRQAHLDHIAHHDGLTALPNRILFHDRLEYALKRAQRSDTQVGLMFLDLDRFKQINDSLGHIIGDKLLKVVASRLVGCVRATDTVSRLGGDEFAVIIEDVTHPDQLASMANKILQAFERPFTLEHHELHTTTSIGIAVAPADDNTVDALIKDADIAMYHAKDLGRNNFKYYSAEMAADVARRLAMENQLRQALEAKQFVLFYQPIVDIKKGDIISTEALLRWNHPERGLLGPAEYLGVLEETGLIKPLTHWILEQASEQYEIYKANGFGHIRVSVNLSGLLIRSESIMDLLVQVIRQSQMDPNGLIMEITEDTLTEDLERAHTALSTLQQMGIRIALDDFGTGQSSLNHLRKNPIDIVKIDRDFIRDIPRDRYDSQLVDAIIAMAHKLHIKVVAEGVEDQAQLDFLRWHHCDAMQGFLFSAPVAGSDVLTLLTDRCRLSG